MRMYERFGIVFLVLAAVCQVVLAVVAGTRTDLYGIGYAVGGTIFSLFGYALQTAVALVVLLHCQAHRLDYKQLRRAITLHMLPVKLVRKQIKAARKLVARTSEASSSFHGILFAAGFTLTFLYMGLMLFAPARSDFVRSFFAAPTMFHLVWMVMASVQVSGVTRAAHKLVDTAQQGFLEEGLERKLGLAHYLTQTRLSMHVYGYEVGRSFVVVTVSLIGFCILLMVQRLFTLVWW